MNQKISSMNVNSAEGIFTAKMNMNSWKFIVKMCVGLRCCRTEALLHSDVLQSRQFYFSTEKCALWMSCARVKWFILTLQCLHALIYSAVTGLLKVFTVNTAC